MCLAAIHWSKIETVFYGASIADAQEAGFAELSVPAMTLVQMGGSKLRVCGDLLTSECAALFTLWKKAGVSKPY
jgi:tRNA(Arg) A34 adenosine deaminase TadA